MKNRDIIPNEEIDYIMARFSGCNKDYTGPLQEIPLDSPLNAPVIIDGEMAVIKKDSTEEIFQSLRRGGPPSKPLIYETVQICELSEEEKIDEDGHLYIGMSIRELKELENKNTFDFEKLARN